MTGSGSGRRRPALYLTITLGVVAALIAVLFGLSRLHLTGSSAVKPDNTPVTNGATPSLPTASPAAFSASDPFAGTPADSYADGAAGVVVPAPHAVGGYSASEVRAAYQTVRRILIAEHLNHKILAGGSPDAFARLLIPAQRSRFDRNLDKP